MQKKRKGFTLAELLIVVAIIAVLVAISIPIFSSQLTKSKIAVDQANVRSAKAAAAAEYMSNNETGEVPYIYDGSKAIKITGSSSVSSVITKSGYGKSKGKDNTEENGKYKTGASGTPENGYVEVWVDDSESSGQQEQIRAAWVSNVTFTGDLSAAGLREQIEKSGMNPDDVVAFTAQDNTLLDSNTTGKQSLANLFAGYKNLRVIDLSKATLKSGDMNLFQGIPDTVTEIDLPHCDGDYNIRGTWYYKDGSRVKAQIKTSGADLEVDTRILASDVQTRGNRIYRYPPGNSK